MRKIRITFAVLCVSLIAGCGVHNKYVSPEIDTEGYYRDYADTTATDTTATVGDVRWEEFFSDPYLQSLIGRALEHNTDIQTAYLKTEQAEAALKTAKLAFAPSFNMPMQGYLSSWDMGKANYAYDLPVVASWEIDAFGKLKNEKRRAQAVYKQSLEYVQAVQTWLIATVANTYYTLLMLDAQLELSEQTAEIWKENVRVMQELKKAGMTNAAAVSQAEANYYAIEASLLDLRRQVYEVENALCILLAVAPDEIERGRLEEYEFDFDISLGLPIQLLSCRPDVKSAELVVEQAFYATAAARSGYYPSIILSGSAGWTNDAGGIIMNPGKLLASAVASVTQPIFNASRTKAKVRIAKAQQQEALLSFERTVLNAGTEVINAMKQIETAQDKAEHRQGQITSLESAVGSTELLMRHGSSTYLEVLTAQQALLNAQMAEISDKFEMIQGTINLYHALGGGVDCED